MKTKNKEVWKKCKTCKDKYTPNESGVCDTCLMKKYGLYDKVQYDALDSLLQTELIELEFVLKIIDKFEVKSKVKQ